MFGPIDQRVRPCALVLCRYNMHFAKKWPDSKLLKPVSHYIPADLMHPAHNVHLRFIEHINST